jgi:hypothetical protein
VKICLEGHDLEFHKIEYDEETDYYKRYLKCKKCGNIYRDSYIREHLLNAGMQIGRKEDDMLIDEILKGDK